MEVKLIELRDRATLIPMMAVRLTYRDVKERFLLRRAGFGDAQTAPSLTTTEVEPYVILSSLIDGSLGANYDSFAWQNQRTFGTAHRWIIENWRSIQPGQVVDVEFILRESLSPKQSEFVTQGAEYRAAYGD